VFRSRISELFLPVCSCGFFPFRLRGAARLSTFIPFCLLCEAISAACLILQGLFAALSALSHRGARLRLSGMPENLPAFTSPCQRTALFLMLPEEFSLPDVFARKRMSFFLSSYYCPLYEFSFNAFYGSSSWPFRNRNIKKTNRGFCSFCFILL
jgi:hypothetical protein